MAEVFLSPKGVLGDAGRVLIEVPLAMVGYG